MNENKDIVESLGDAIKSILVNIGGIALVGVIVGCVFAPVFSNFIRESLMQNPDGTYINISRLSDVDRKMVIVDTVLWIIAILSWIGLIVLGINYNWN